MTSAARRALAVAATAALALLTAAPADAVVVPGARYDAVGGKPPQRQFVTVSKDGKRIVRYAVATNGKCTDGKPWDVTLNHIREPRTAVKADGTFANPPTPTKTILLRQGLKAQSGTLAVGMTATSSPDGNQIVVQVTGSFKNKRLRCRAKGPITLVRAGTPGAPVASPRLFNGSYGNTSAPNLRISGFSMLAAAGEFSGLRVRSRLRCPDGAPETGTFTLLPQLLTLRDTYDETTVTSGRLRGAKGARYTLTDRLTLRFTRRGSNTYSYAGTYQAVSVHRRKGRVYETCRLPTTRFGSTVTPPTP